MSDGRVVTVCAVAAPRSDLNLQTRPPDDLVETADSPKALASAVEQAAAGGHDWLWIVASDVVPAPDALEALIAPVADPAALDDPVLFASKVVRASDGRLDMDAPPWPRLLARELAMAGADHRLAALRAARAGSLLVQRRAVEIHGPPRRDFATAGGDLEWTGRILRDEPGYLVPASIAVRDDRAAPDLETFTRERVRILRGDGWRGQEKAWFAFLLTQDLMQHTADRPAAAVGLARAVGRGLRAPA